VNGRRRRTIVEYIMIREKVPLNVCASGTQCGHVRHVYVLCGKIVSNKQMNLGLCLWNVRVWATNVNAQFWVWRGKNVESSSSNSEYLTQPTCIFIGDVFAMLGVCFCRRIFIWFYLHYSSIQMKIAFVYIFRFIAKLTMLATKIILDKVFYYD
jgi:hypothetical protein